MKKTEFLKHEELYSAPLCKLYAFEAKRVLCQSFGNTNESGKEPGYENSYGDDDL